MSDLTDEVAQLTDDKSLRVWSQLTGTDAAFMTIKNLSIDLIALRAECKRLREQLLEKKRCGDEYIQLTDEQVEHLSGQIERLEDQLAAATAALTEISKGEGPFNRDQLEHASNAIDSMKSSADDALATIQPAEPKPLRESLSQEYQAGLAGYQDPTAEPKPCATCGGKGSVETTPDSWVKRIPCPACNGEGVVKP